MAIINRDKLVPPSLYLRQVDDTTKKKKKKKKVVYMWQAVAQISRESVDQWDTHNRWKVRKTAKRVNGFADVTVRGRVHLTLRGIILDWQRPMHYGL